MKSKKADIAQEIQNLEHKYFNLVWYARKNPNEDDSYWDGVPEAIKEGAFEAMANVERDYPVEVDELQSDDSDWHHGFNSGVLAALRFVMTANEINIEQAKEWFPELDT